MTLVAKVILFPILLLVFFETKGQIVLEVGYAEFFVKKVSGSYQFSSAKMFHNPGLLILHSDSIYQFDKTLNSYAPMLVKSRNLYFLKNNKICLVDFPMEPRRNPKSKPWKRKDINLKLVDGALFFPRVGLFVKRKAFRIE
jgi:hypothetical protein